MFEQCVGGLHGLWDCLLVAGCFEGNIACLVIIHEMLRDKIFRKTFVDSLLCFSFFFTILIVSVEL